MASPSDMVGPSPVTSNGTETTEIEDEVADEAQEIDSASSVESTEVQQSAVSSRLWMGLLNCRGHNTDTTRS